MYRVWSVASPFHSFVTTCIECWHRHERYQTSQNADAASTTKHEVFPLCGFSLSLFCNLLLSTNARASGDSFSHRMFCADLHSA